MGIFNCFSPPSWRVGKVAKNKGVYMEIPIILLILILITIINPRSLLEKIVTRSLEGEGGSIGPPPPSIFDTIHPIDLKFGTHSKLRFYFQLRETTWCLIGFHGNNSQINDVTGAAILDFQIFRFCSNFHFCTSD